MFLFIRLWPYFFECLEKNFKNFQYKVMKEINFIEKKKKKRKKTLFCGLKIAEKQKKMIFFFVFLLMDSDLLRAFLSFLFFN